MTEMNLGVLANGPHADLIREMARMCYVDRRIQAIWVGGSLASGTGDVYSDVDFRIAIEPGRIDEWASPDWKKYLPIQPRGGNIMRFGEQALLHHMILPALVLGIGPAAATARYQRSAILEVIEQDYIRTARAKGLSPFKVVWKHVMRNSLIPVITLFGLTLPFLVSGSVIVEQIFSWPGMGREAIKAISGRDVFVLSGITLIATTMVVIGSLVADLLYAVVDPRVRLQ